MALPESAGRWLTSRTRLRCRKAARVALIGVYAATREGRETMHVDTVPLGYRLEFGSLIGAKPTEGIEFCHRMPKWVSMSFHSSSEGKCQPDGQMPSPRTVANQLYNRPEDDFFEVVIVWVCPCSVPFWKPGQVLGVPASSNSPSADSVA